ncbi:MAG: isoprenylcysteine carboxylmethyltransferase family protein [Pseudomonadota bacterium]
MVKRIIYPPIWLVLGIVAVFTCNELYPVVRFTSLLSQIVGGIIIVIGLYLLVAANGLFVRAGTEIVPFRQVSTLVTTGVYRFSRNPMYLGMTAVLLGCAITVGVVSALLVPVLFIIIIEFRYVRQEEELLHQLFPEEFSSYCGQVRRWL